MSCPHAESCSLFEELTLASMRRFWGARYCETNHKQCERFRRAQEGKQVASTLCPNGMSLTQRAQRVQRAE